MKVIIVGDFSNRRIQHMIEEYKDIELVHIGQGGSNSEFNGINFDNFWMDECVDIDLIVGSAGQACLKVRPPKPYYRKERY